MRDNKNLQDDDSLQSVTETTTTEGTMTADDVATHLEGSQQNVPPETLAQLGIGKDTGGGSDVVAKDGGKKGSIFTSPEMEFEKTTDDDDTPTTTSTETTGT